MDLVGGRPHDDDCHRGVVGPLPRLPAELPATGHGHVVGIRNGRLEFVGRSKRVTRRSTKYRAECAFALLLAEAVRIVRPFRFPGFRSLG